MSTVTLRRTWLVEGVATNPTSVTLSNAAGTIGIIRNDTGASVVAAGTAMTNTGTGIYETTFTEPAAGLTYTAWIKIVYGGHTYYFEVDLTGATADSIPTALITAAQVLAELGIASPTSIQTAIINNAIVFATGAVRRFLGYDPLYRSRTEYYPQQYFQVRSQEPVWEVNDLVAYVRQPSSIQNSDLQLKNLPVRSITSLYVDYDGRSGKQTGAFAASTQKTEGTDFWANYDLVDSSGVGMCSDGILRSVGGWPNTPGTVKVTYASGYKAAELSGADGVVDASGIWMAALIEATKRSRRGIVMASTTRGLPVGPLTSENLGDYSYSADGSAISNMFGGDLSGEAKEALWPFVNCGLYL